MILIIDGYNLLKLIHGPQLSEMQINAFINLIGRYIKKRNHKVIIVFDAGPCTYPLQEKSHGVTLLYSGAFQSADDIIIKFTKDNPQKEIVVISADRELLEAIKSHNTDDLNPITFYEKIKEICTNLDNSLIETNHKQINKFSNYDDSETTPNIDDLMYEAAGMQIPTKEESHQTIPSIKKNSLSKKNRLKIKTINKL